MRTLPLLVILVACGGSDDVIDPDTSDPTTTTTPPTHWAMGDDFLAIAHRGGAAVAPENTMAAFQAAYDSGARVMEFDIFKTSDGELVIFHDETVDRTTDGTGNIKEMTLAELQALDAGYNFTTDNGTTFPFRGTGVTIPTLDELFTAFPDVFWDVEIKQIDPPIYNDVVATIEEFDIADRVFIACFDDPTIQAFRADHPTYVTNMGDNEYAAWAAVAETNESYTPPGQIPQIWDVFYNDALPPKADAMGVKLHVWTVNDPVKMGQMIDEGVHGIITDDPAALLQIMADKGIEGI